jgi:tetratricopeptide (TPR) repeat protein
MSRFQRLEFNDSAEGARNNAGASSVRGASGFLSEADGFFRAADFRSALRSFSRVLEFEPGNVSAWVGQVRSLIELGEFQEAKLWAEKALDQFPNEPELLGAKSVALARLGDLDGAIAFSDAAFQEPGESPYLWLSRGDVLLARKENRASYCFEKAVALASGEWLWRWLASRIHFYYNKFAVALKLVQDALALAPANAVIWAQSARCQTALGLLDGARHSVTQALELNPRCPEAALAASEMRTMPLGNRWWRRFRGIFGQ